MIPKRGFRFVHGYWLDSNNKPAVCEVTAVREGVVFYKLDGARKAKEYATLERWPRVCKAPA